MVWFDRTFKQALISAGISLPVYKRYVDDGWLKSVCVPPGFRWDQTSQQVCQVMPALEDQTLPDQRTAIVCCDVANSITSMIQWTPDWPSANIHNKLPVLDLCVWCEETGEGTVTFYQFYSKPMANPGGDKT